DFVHFQLVASEAVGVGDLPAIDDLERVGTSARQAGADRVIDRLPAGLSTQLGRWFEGGVDLSEGEWQRVALARGLMRPSPALLTPQVLTPQVLGEAAREPWGWLTGSRSIRCCRPPRRTFHGPTSGSIACCRRRSAATCASRGCPTPRT